MKSNIDKENVGVKALSLSRWTGQSMGLMKDQVTVEAPLEINITAGSGPLRKKEHLSITMRTPGQDLWLALGFLYTEGLLQQKKDILKTEQPIYRKGIDQDQTVHIHLAPHVFIDSDKLHRHFYTTSSCGVCGKASLDLVRQQISYVLSPQQPQIQLEKLGQWPDQMRKVQSVFAQTGSIHAAGLFDANGNLLYCCEDVGRHNALDKLIGAALEAEELPWQDKIVFLSGRISFELVQKALMAGVPILVAVGAPSSLAVELADAHGMTLIGFLKKDSCNIYCGAQRILW
jgi:FdhD protein